MLTSIVNPYYQQINAVPPEVDSGQTEADDDLPLQTSNNGNGIGQTEETAGLFESQETPPTAPITYQEAAYILLKAAVPLSASQLGNAVQGIGNGMIVRHLSPTEMAAAPLALVALTELISSSLEGTLQSTGALIGQLNGAKKYDEIGAVLTQSGWMGLGLSVPTTLLLRNISSVLSAAGTSKDIAEAVQAYCSALSLGVIPFCWLTGDLLFAQNIQHPEVVSVVKPLRASLSVLLSAPLALGALGLPRLGIAGLGYGAALSAWLSWIGLRFYYASNHQYDVFKLFNLSAPKIKEIYTLLFTEGGLSLGLKEAGGGVNDFIFSLIVEKLGKAVSIAQEASSIPASAVSTILTGLVSATGTEIANGLGKLKEAIERGDEAEIPHLQQNIQRFGNTALVIGGAVTLAVCLLFIHFSRQISETFIDTSTGIPEETLELAQTLLSVNGVNLIIDIVKNIGTINLFNLQDSVLPPLLNVIPMFAGLSAGAYFSLQAHTGPESLFIIQLLGSLIAAMAIAYRWAQKSRSSEYRAVSPTEFA